MKISIKMPLRIATLSLLLLWKLPLPAETGPLSRPEQDTIPGPAVNQVEFRLQGVARNGDTGEKFDHIYVDVYKILPDGSVEIVRTDRFPGGEFEVWLRRDERYMLMMNYNNTAFLEGLLNPTDAEIVDGVLSQIFILDEYRPDLLTSNHGEEEEKGNGAEQSNGLIDPEEASHAEEPATLYTALDETPPAALPGETSENKSMATTENPPLPASAELSGQALDTLYLNGSTSFRSQATHLSETILRFSAGDAVELLEKTDQYWWKVRFNGKTGWVKAAKLQEKSL